MTASTAVGPTTVIPASAETTTRSRARDLRLGAAAIVLAAIMTGSFALGHAVGTGSDQPSGNRPAPPPATAPAAPEATSDPGLCRMGRAC
ncbi:MAG TPA: hypothetical protein VK611_10295 [Acidimicrobiales bacterium]|nr:hypothetical protein [Acidimicrobiales bacterium]